MTYPSKGDIMQFAKNYINMVFADTSVSPEETLERLRELKEDIEIKIDSLKMQTEE